MKKVIILRIAIILIASIFLAGMASAESMFSDRTNTKIENCNGCSYDGKCVAVGTYIMPNHVCGENGKWEIKNLVGNDKDSHGCIGSAGYSWCEEKQKCLRIWEENCSDEKLPGQGKVKILPETASQRARERLGELGFNISLKEVGKGNKTKMFYEAKAKKEGKLFGFLKVKADVSAEIDSETGEVTKVHKPWWSFMATGI